MVTESDLLLDLEAAAVELEAQELPSLARAVCLAKAIVEDRQLANKDGELVDRLYIEQTLQRAFDAKA